MSDESEFSLFVKQRSTGLLRTACLLCSGDVGAGEDLLQDTLVEVYRRWSSIRDPASREAYVRRVLVRQASRRWRRRTRQRSQSLLLHDVPDISEVDAPQVLDMQAALRILPPEQRAVIVLRYYEDLSEAQIAEIVGCPPGTVKSRATLALRKMASLVEVNDAVPPPERRLL
jgi:RNA polymerase sigma-70 factor (sigma-E family)